MRDGVSIEVYRDGDWMPLLGDLDLELTIALRGGPPRLFWSRTGADVEPPWKVSILSREGVPIIYALTNAPFVLPSDEKSLASA